MAVAGEAQVQGQVGEVWFAIYEPIERCSEAELFQVLVRICLTNSPDRGKTMA